VVKVLCYKSEGRWFDPSWWQWIFRWHKIPPIALWTWGRLSLEQKWVPGEFPGGKSGRCVRLTTLPPSCAVVTKSGSLNFLEPSGPVQACNGDCPEVLRTRPVLLVYPSYSSYITACTPASLSLQWFIEVPSKCGSYQMLRDGASYELL